MKCSECRFSELITDLYGREYYTCTFDPMNPEEEKPCTGKWEPEEE